MAKSKKEIDTSINDRFIDFLNQNSISITDASNATGLSRESFYNIRDYRSLPSADTLIKMYGAYFKNGFSIEYTLTGNQISFKEYQMQQTINELKTELKSVSTLVAEKDEMLKRKDDAIMNLSSALGKFESSSDSLLIDTELGVNTMRNINALLGGIALSKRLN